MKHIVFSILISILLISCQQNKSWQEVKTIDLGNVTPIGITAINNSLYISDGDHNQVVEFNQNGEILNTFKELERPMHLDTDGESVFVPEYGTDNITIINTTNGKKSQMPLAKKDSLDALAGIALYQNERAIADFYNHRILYFNGSNWISFGQEGKEKGAFYYPTDVQITADKIYVADAYNNRIQVFDKQGNALSIIGKEEKMNAATGLYVSEKEIFVTDFENDRVLIYNHKGELKQTINQGLEKPTDLLVIGSALYIINYKGKNIKIFE